MKKRLHKLGYIEDTPIILEYKRLKVETDKKEGYLKLVKSRNKKNLVIRKKGLEGKVLENELLQDRISN